MEEWRLLLEVTMRILWRRCFGHVPLQTDSGLAVSMAERKEIARLVASVHAVRALGHHYEDDMPRREQRSVRTTTTVTYYGYGSCR